MLTVPFGLLYGSSTKRAAAATGSSDGYDDGTPECYVDGTADAADAIESRRQRSRGVAYGSHGMNFQLNTSTAAPAQPQQSTVPTGMQNPAQPQQQMQAPPATVVPVTSNEIEEPCLVCGKKGTFSRAMVAALSTYTLLALARMQFSRLLVRFL